MQEFTEPSIGIQWQQRRLE